jgi:hypothetical protein
MPGPNDRDTVLRCVKSPRGASARKAGAMRVQMDADSCANLLTEIDLTSFQSMPIETMLI